jgi:hypothetical protein
MDDERIEAFLRAALGLEGSSKAQVREGVRIYLQEYEREFPDIGRASYRERVVQEIVRQKRTPTKRHLSIVLEVIDGTAIFPLNN